MHERHGAKESIHCAPYAPSGITAPSVMYAASEHRAIEPSVLVTSQQREQSDEVLGILSIGPDTVLGLFAIGHTLPDLTFRVLPAATSMFHSSRPALVQVLFDTADTLAIALSAFFEGIPAGQLPLRLRDINLGQQFPEESNTKPVAAIGTFELPPTALARDNVLREGRVMARLRITGNAVVGSAHFALISRQSPEYTPTDRPIVAITMHRSESLPLMQELAVALASIAVSLLAPSYVHPVHLTPTVLGAGWQVRCSAPIIMLGEPWGCTSKVILLRKSEVIVTDSEGTHEPEAAQRFPVALLRNLTDCSAVIHARILKLLNNEPTPVVQVPNELLRDKTQRNQIRHRTNPYGGSRTGKPIVDEVARNLGPLPKPESWSVMSSRNGETGVLA